jgi:predicted transposase YdaD
MMLHDESYKHIFSHPEVMEDLLRGFVHEEWISEIDCDTLEKVSGSYVTDDLRDREDDIVWRVRLKSRWVYVYLLLEFQSSVDKWMALRVMVYTGLLYQDLIKSGACSDPGRLPTVFPVVLYNGVGPWNAARNMRDLIETVPGSLESYRPKHRYFLVDEGRTSEDDPLPADNLVADLIRIEFSPDPESLGQAVAALRKRLQAPQYHSLRRALVIWMNRVVLKRLVPDEAVPEIHDLQEVQAMLADGFVPWTEKWRQEGLKQGLEQGIEQGIEQGRREQARNLLRRQLNHRFGPLDEWAEERLALAELDELEAWAERLLDAESLESVFDTA